MRTTVEIRDEHRAALCEIAARRGEKGLSSIVEEALTAYLRAQKRDSAASKKVLRLRGSLAGREAAKVMVPRKRGTILFTGATASVRGGVGYAAFAGGKHALRALAQSMARELGPEGIHVAHVVVDGAIDTEFTRQRAPDRYEDRKAVDGILNPDSIAENYWLLHCQPRDAWTHELDLRPWSEAW